MAQQELDNSGTTIDEVSLQVRKRKRCSGASPTPPGSDGKDSSHSTAEHAGPGCEATEQLQPTSSHHLERSWGSALRQTNSLQSGHVQSGCTGCEDADGWTEEGVCPSDTMVALQLMLSQFPKVIEKVAARPFVLRSQLYSSLKDRTEVDRELENLRRSYKVRMFKLNTGQDDYALMLMNDYMTQVNASEERLKAKRSGSEIAVFQWFKDHVLSSNCDVFISHHQLVTSLSQGGKYKDNHLSVLINAGLLVRRLTDDSSYWFSIPNVGFLLKNLSEGRKELLSFINKRRYKEVLQAELERRRLRYSQLDVRFHLRDLLGSGKLQSVETTVGPLIRLARD